MTEFIIIENDDAAQIAGCIFKTKTRMEIIRHFMIAITRTEKI